MATGIFKQLRYKAESSWAATAVGTGGYTLLRRKSSNLDEVRETYGSDEIQTTQQRTIYVHGARHAEGQIVGDLSGKTYQDMFAALLRRDFTSVTNLTGLSVTIGTGSGTPAQYAISGGTGWLAGGVKAGMVVRLAGAGFGTGNVNKNIWVTSATSTGIVGIPWGGTLTPEGPIASGTCIIPGMIDYIPASGHTNKSFTFEHFFADVGTGSQSEVFNGCKVGSADLNLPARGLIEATFGVMGRGFAQAPSGSAYFSGSATTTSSAGVTAVNGLLRAGSGLVTSLTGVTIRVNGNPSVGQVVGSNYTPDVFMGSLIANGQMTAYFQDATLRDAFYNESTIALSLVAYAGTTANAEFLAFTLPAIKLGGAEKNDVPGPLILTIPYEALYNGAGGAAADSEATTFWMQDSLAT